MKVVLSTIGKFHIFDLARELHASGLLSRIYTGYPRWKLLREGLPGEYIDTFPWFQTPYMFVATRRWRSPILTRAIGELARRAHDRCVRHRLEPCDVFVGLSGHNLLAGRRAKSLGAKWVCDRGSSHIIAQRDVMKAENAKWGTRYIGSPTAVVEQELAEYAEADAIAVPSSFAYQTFRSQGVPESKLAKIPYGVDLRVFEPVAIPDPSGFDIAFVGQVTLRKGVFYLLEAFGRLRHPKKRLRVVGVIDPLIEKRLRKCASLGVEFLGPRPQGELKKILSSSHVFVLPSVEEGLALVQAQAMACGCPPVCAESTGARDLFSDGVEGYIVPSGDVNALVERLERLAFDFELRMRMSGAALARVQALGGWREYGVKYIDFIRGL